MRLRLLVATALAMTVLPLARVDAQHRFLGKADIQVFGLGLRVEPAVQTVPKGFATIVSTFLQGSAQPGAIPPFAPDAEMRATLRGPSFAQPIDLVAAPNTPFQIPLLTVAGTHTVENIRLVSGGEVVLYGTPETARIEVIDKLLVTTVTARPLTAEEIREKGIVFDKDSFQAYNFTAAFAIDDGSRIDINFPVVLPTLAPPQDVAQTVATLQNISVPALRGLQTIIPDTLQIQARIPNLSVVGFTLNLDQGASSQDFYVPPIPGVIVIPGDIGFLNQFFSVMLMVANVAPEGANLVVSELSASIVLPPGKDNVVGSNDDPLAMARRAGGETPRIVPVTRPGPDGILGNGDDLTTLGPQQTGNAEFLVEGRREGTHVVEMELAGTLNGLPVGPVPVRGRAAGVVLVRNPTFTLTFTHPDVVNVGEPYTLDVTVTNTSESPANFVSLNLFAPNISGARLDDEPSKAIESIAPGDSATVTYRLISNRTGKVTAATLDSDENIAGRFQLKTAIGELGVPLSPDSLVLPKESQSLPQELRNAALGLLGRAWAVATAPPAALPKDLTRFSKQVVLDRAVQTAEAGFRLTLGEPLSDLASSLLMDYLGSEFTELPQRVPQPDTNGLLAMLQKDVQGFDLVRRRSVRGDVFAAAISDIIRDPLLADPLGFHRALAEKLTSRAGHVSVFLTAAGNALPVEGVLIDSGQRRTGGVDAGKVVKEIPFSDAITVLSAGGSVVGQLFFVAVPEVGEYTVRLARRQGTPSDAAFDVTVAYPAADGTLRFASITGVGPSDVPAVQHSDNDATRVRFSLAEVAAPAEKPGAPAAVIDPPPTLLGAVQMAHADIVGCTTDELGRVFPAGRIIAVLFSERVTAESVQDKLRADEITAFQVDGNRVVGVALQPGGRIAFIALREPFGPFVARTLTAQNARDRSGQAMTGSVTVPMVATVPADIAGLISGRILNADGTPAAFSSVRLFYEFVCFGDIKVDGIAEEITDANGRYAFDYVLAVPGMTVKLAAIDSERDELRIVRFKLARPGQHLNVDVVLLGRGTLRGRTLAEDGSPLADTALRITSLTDQSEYAATSDANGVFEVARIPVGNVLIEAVNVVRGAQVFVSEHLPFAGAVVSRDVVLLDVDSTPVEMKKGSISGRVVRSDGVTAVSGVPVVAYYKTRSQDGLACPKPPGATQEPSECAIGVITTNGDGQFAFPSVPAGEIRLNTFDQVELMEGNVRVAVFDTQNSDATILLAGGFGTVTGVVLDASGQPVADAVVGGGLSLATVNPNGTFTLTDVPVGKRRIVAVSEALDATGETTVDIVQQGEVVQATVVLQPIGAIAGIVRNSAGVPQAGIKVWVFVECFDEFLQPSICIKGEDVTDPDGSYRIDGLPIGTYTVSAFRADMKDGNLNQFAIRFNRQVLINNITFRGGLGTVQGRVLRACAAPPCADTPLAAKVGISGERLTVAGGKIGVKFEHVNNYEITDNDFSTGEYSFDDVWVGPFTVRAAGQFSPEPVAVEGTIPAAGQSVTVDIRLMPTSQVTGTVYESDGFTPVSNRTISVNYKSNAVVVFCSEDELGLPDCTTIPQGIQEYPAVTDALGRFSFPIVNAGAFTITATDPQTGKIGEVQGSVRAGDTVDVSVRLLGRANVTVRVFRSDGNTPIPGAAVQLQQISYPKATRSGVAVDGTVTFGGGDALSEGQFVITATGPGGFAGRAAGRVLVDGQPVTVDVFLFDATATVTGQVFREDATAGLVNVPNAEVIISNASGPMGFTVSDAAGVFSLPLVPTGPFTIEAFDPSTAARGRAAGTVFAGNEPVSVSVRLEPLGSIRGSVVQSGNRAPLKGWTVTLTQVTPAGRSLPQQMAQTSVDGTFAFPGASIGTFHLRVSHRDVVGVGIADGSITLGGQLVDVPMVVNVVRRVTGRVTGLVANPGGTPAANAQVEVCGSGDPCRATTADGDGRFSLQDVPLGRFTVRASAQVSGNPSVGTTGGTVLFDGDTADVTVTLLGLSVIEGTVFELVNGVRQPAANATVRLYGQPGSGCNGACQRGTDPQGRFQFINVPAHTFTVVAAGFDGQQGAVGGSLIPGQTKSGLEVVLAPAIVLSGRVLAGSGAAAGGVVAELQANGGSLFAETNADGLFSFDAVSAGPYTLRLQDPIGSGIARRVGTIVVAGGAINLGDITLDEAAPLVTSATPADGAQGVSRSPEIRVTFSERLNAATVNASTMTLVGPDGQVGGQIDTLDNDSVARFRLLPGVQLKDQARYTVRLNGVADLAGRVMSGDFTAAFMTVDLTPPSIVETTPTTGASGVTIDTTIRVRYSEIVNPTLFNGAAVTLLGPAGAVDGRIDFAFSNTLAIFTPARPLAEDTLYTVRIARATDVTGQQQAADTEFQFATTDRTPPVVVSLVPSNNGMVIQNATVSVAATVAPSDVSVVDFFINDVFTFADRQPPFTLALQAAPQFGGPGSKIKVGAVAVDTSGNRSVVTAEAFLEVTADQPPVVTTTQPAGEINAPAGQRIDVGVEATDDLGVAQIGYLVRGAGVIDAATRTVTPAALSRTETFGFNVPVSAAPGSLITIEASATDTAGQTTPAAIRSIRVLDTIGPLVEITGVSSGQRVQPGQVVTVVVQASDPGLLKQIGLDITGVLARTEQRAVDPARSLVATSFQFTVPVNASSTDAVTLQAFALDVAGNRGNSAQTTLPVADKIAPTVSVRTLSGSLDVIRGVAAQIVVEAVDDVALASLRLQASGANGFTFDDTRSVAPTSPASFTFTVPIPDTLVGGQQVVLTGHAVDASGNPSTPTTISVTVRDVETVTLPASVSLDAGRSQQIEVSLSAPAPAGGLSVALQSRSSAIATVTPLIVIGEGQTSALVTVSGVRGGTTQIDALVSGVVRQTMTVTVAGGIVRGVVRKMDGALVPVADAQVTVFHAGTPLVTTSGPDGTFTLAGVSGAGTAGRDFSVRASDGTLLGFVDAQLTVAGGSADVDVVLIAAGSIDGTVSFADGVRAGAGVKIELFESTAPSVVIATTFTDSAGQWLFPLVAPGPYRVDVADQAGNRGRADVVVVSGANTSATISFLGRGMVTGLVRSGANVPVANASLELHASSVFGGAPMVTGTTDADGRFTFTDVYVGTVTVKARDLSTNQAGSGTGQIAANNGKLDLVITLSSYGNLRGTVRRVDDITVAPGAQVNVRMQGGAQFNTTTDQDGKYAFDFLPFEPSYTVTVRDPATRGLGLGLGGFSTSGETVTTDVTLFPQGALLVTVVDANGQPVNGATVSAQTTAFGLFDSLQGVTSTLDGVAGRVLLDRLLAGAFNVSATAAGLSGSTSGTLPEGDVLPVTIALEPVGTIAGDVFDQDGQSPAAGNVRVFGAGGNVVATIPLVNGHYSVTLRLGTYTLEARDSGNRRRALSAPTTLAANGELVTRNFTFVALGTVSGRVIHPVPGGDVGNLVVTVRSLDPIAGGLFSDHTDAAGNYVVTGVPVGFVTATSAKASEQLGGESSGTLVYTPPAPAQLSLDIQLLTNTVNLPTTLVDGNGSSLTIGQGAGLVGSTAGTFNADGGGLALDVLPSGGSAARFTGSAFGTREGGNREIAVRQEGLAGLNVTRKVFLPSTGYFARYLELLSNPGASPITVDVAISSRIYGGRFQFCSFKCERRLFLGGTSSGDAVLDVGGTTPDRWLSLGGSGDPYANSQDGASLSFVLGGDDAAVAVGSAAYLNNDPNELPFLRPLLTYTWHNVTVPAGQTIALMHFVSYQGLHTAAVASAERLVQLPPEALDGLSAEELGAVQNFVMPANGISLIDPLPAITGTLSGRVLEGDGVSIVPNTTVTFQSSIPVHPRRLTFGVSAAGTFSFTGAPGAPVPLGGFSLTARHPINQFRTSPAVVATFVVPQTSLTQDVVFTDGGILTGVVRRTNQTPVSGAIVEIPGFASQQTDANGRYRFGGVIAGTPSLRGSVPRPQGDGTALSIPVQSFALAAGQVRDDVLLVEPAGVVTGILTDAAGVPQLNKVVTFTHVDGLFSRTAQTDGASGRFTFADLRIGNGTLRAVNSANGFAVTRPVAVLEENIVTADLSYQGNLTLSVLVTRANGSALPGMQVRASGSGFSVTAVSGPDGIASLANVPLGQVTTVLAWHPQLMNVLQRQTTFTTLPDTPPLTLALPAFGIVTGQVTRPNGTPAGLGVPVNISGVNPTFTLPQVQSNSSSLYTFGPVPVGQSFTVSVRHPNTTVNGTFPTLPFTSQLVADDQALTLNVHYPAISQLTISVSEDGKPLAGSTIQEHINQGSNPSRGVTLSSGVLVVPQVAEGLHTYRVLRPGTSTVIELATVNITAANDGGNVNLPIEVKRFTITIRGTILDADGAPLPNPQPVNLLRAGDRQLLGSVCVGGVGSCAGTIGQFTFAKFDATNPIQNAGAGVATGAGVIVQVRSPFLSFEWPPYEQLVVPTADGQIDVTVNMPFRRATVHGRVLAGDGSTPVGTGNVSLNRVADTSTALSSSANVAADGTWAHAPQYFPIEGVRAKLWNVSGLPNGTVQATSGPITTPNQDVSIDLILPATTMFTQVTGVVTAGDGTTAIENANLTLSTSQGDCCNAGTDAQGRFTFRAALPSNGEFTLKATAPIANSPQLTRSFTATGQGGNVDAGTLAIPISTLSGRVTFGDSLAAPDVTVIVKLGSQNVDFLSTDSDGRFRRYGLAPGDYTLVAQHFQTGYSATAAATIVDTTTHAAANIQLPPVGTVRVRVFDRNGQPTNDAEVVLTLPGATFENYCGNDHSIVPSNGECLFEYVPTGGFLAQAKLEECFEDENGDEVCNAPVIASANGMLNDAGETLTLDIRFDRLGQVAFRTDPNWVNLGRVSPGDDVRITVRAMGANGPFGTYEVTTIVQASAQPQTITFGDVPPGAVVVLADRQHVGWVEPLARVEGVLPTNHNGIPLDVDLADGFTYANFWYGLRGADDWYYFIERSGHVAHGALLSGSDLIYGNAFFRLNGLDVNGVDAEDARVPGERTVAGAPEVIVGPFANNGPAYVTRRVWTPPSGQFARYLEVFSNDTAVPVTVHPTLEAHGTSIDRTETVPSPTSGGSLVYANNGADRAVFGLAFAGPDAPVKPEIGYNGFDDNIWFNEPRVRASFTIPPFSKASLLHFVVLGAPGDGAAVSARTAALVDLTHPNALAGLTSAELATIVNYRFTRIRGQVLASDAATPVGNTLVELKADGAPCVGCVVTANGNGEFEIITALPSGALTLTMTPAIPGATPIEVPLTAAPLDGVIEAGTIEIDVSVLRGRVTFGVDTPAPETTVRARVGGDVVATTVTSAQGTYAFVGLPAATYELEAEHLQSGSTASASATIADGSSVITTDMALPPASMVRVNVFDEAGQLVTPERVALSTPSGSYSQMCGAGLSIAPDENGQCRFDFVPNGDFHAQAQLTYCDGGACRPTHAYMTGQVMSPGSNVPIDVTFQHHGRVYIQTNPAWVGGPVNAGDPVRITLRAMGANGPNGSFERTVMLNATSAMQEVEFGAVPPGPLVVTAERFAPEKTWQALSRMTDHLQPGQHQSVDFDLAQSPAAGGFPYPLQGSDGWQHVVGVSGHLQAAARDVGGALLYGNAFTQLNHLTVNSAFIWDARALSPIGADEGQEVQLGPLSTTTPAYVTRRLYVPVDGGYMRYLDVFANDTDIPVRLDVVLRSFSTTANLRDMALPAPNEVGVLVYEQSENERASLGLALAGLNPVVVPTLTFPGGALSAPELRVTLAIPPHSKQALLHYVVLREPSDAAGASSRTFDLAFVSDSSALALLSAEDLAMIVNFPIP
jgi:hypothetical protein